MVYSNHFTLLVAIILSAQCTDKKVNQVTAELFPKYDSPAKILSLGIDDLKVIIKSIGLYNTKAKNIVSLSEILIEKFNNQVPATLDELTSLPGVGRKSANVFLNTIYKMPVMAVDTHVFRMAKRLGLSYSNNLVKVEKDLIEKIPKKFLIQANQLLVLHGRYICKARSPSCSSCPIIKYCVYYKTNIHNTS